MLISRGIGLCKTLATVKQQKVLFNSLKFTRNHGTWVYRKAAPPAPAKVQFTAEAISAFAWWWIFWHLFTEPEHIYGEFEFPDVSKWTDEELGIPN